MACNQRGLLIPIDTVEFSASDSTYTEAGRHAGQPVPASTNRGRVGLRCAHVRRDEGEYGDPGVIVTANRGGLPEPSRWPARIPAAVTWRYGDEAATADRGHNGWWYPSGIKAAPYEVRDVVAWRGGLLLACVDDTGLIPVGHVVHLDQDGEVITDWTVAGGDVGDGRLALGLCIVRGRPHVYWLTWRDLAITRRNTVRGSVLLADDDAEWTELKEGAQLETQAGAAWPGANLASERIAAACVGDVVMLCVGTTDDPGGTSRLLSVALLRSTDAGHSFEPASQHSNVASFDVASAGTGFLYAYQEIEDPEELTPIPTAYRVGRFGPGEGLNEAIDRAQDAVTKFDDGGDDAWIESSVAVGEAPDGSILVGGFTEDRRWEWNASYDGGDTWYGQVVFEPTDGTIQGVRDACIAWVPGRVARCGDSRILWGGRYSNVAWPVPTPYDALEVAYTKSWMAWWAWTTTTNPSATAPTIALDATVEAWRFTAPGFGGVGDVLYTQTLSTAEVASWLRASVKVDGAAPTGGAQPLRVELLVDGFGVRVFVRDDGIDFGFTDSTSTWSDGAADTWTADAGGTEVEIVLAIDKNGNARAAWRRPQHDRRGIWHTADDGGVALDTANNGATVLVTTDDDPEVSVWIRDVVIGHDLPTQVAVYGWLNVEQNGAPLSTRPVPLDQDFAVYATSDTPAMVGDAWTAPVAFDAPVAALADPSPRRGWRAEVPAFSAVDTTLAWRWDPSYGPGRVLGVVCVGCSFSTYVVQVYVPGTGWTDIGSRVVNRVPVVVKNGGDFGAELGVPQIVQRDEFAGGWIVPWPEVDQDASNVMIPILSHTAGTDNTVGGGEAVRVRLHAEDDVPRVSDGDNAVIVPPSHVVLVRLPLDTPVSGLRLVVTPGDVNSGVGPAFPPGQQWRGGVAWVGQYIPLADEYGWGRVVEVLTNTEVETARDGAKRSAVRGPGRRRVEVGWPDGVETLGGWSGTGEVEPIAFGDDDSRIAWLGSTPSDLDAVMRYVAGPGRPIVYLPSVEVPPSDEEIVLINRRRDLVYGRLADAVRLESVQGDELDGEVWRIATIQIDEEV